jgi:hypothetical protein|tara:strand:+ start:1597 stop:1800 length:204 start_codon:yes stop_codon:yes gene_type:complete
MHPPPRGGLVARVVGRYLIVALEKYRSIPSQKNLFTNPTFDLFKASKDVPPSSGTVIIKSILYLSKL